MSVVMFFMSIAICVFVAKMEAEHDAKKVGKIEHFWSALWRVLAALVCGFVLHNSYFHPSESIFWVCTISWIFLMGVVYWIPFDYFYNVKKEIDIFYRGNTSLLDTISKYVILKGKGYVVFKFILLGICGYIYWDYLGEILLGV